MNDATDNPVAVLVVESTMSLVKQCIERKMFSHSVHELNTIEESYKYFNKIVTNRYNKYVQDLTAITTGKEFIIVEMYKIMEQELIKLLQEDANTWS